MMMWKAKKKIRKKKINKKKSKEKNKEIEKEIEEIKRKKEIIHQVIVIEYI